MVRATALRDVILYQLTPEAEDDLFEIWLHIANDNRRDADRVETAIYRACESLAVAPLHGHLRPDLTHLPLRFLDSASLS